jgi:hypothetical protein
MNPVEIEQLLLTKFPLEICTIIIKKGEIMSWEYAATYGHLDVIKWLHENRIEGCTRDVMSGAAYNGHLDIVKWLYENRTDGFAAGGMCLAAWSGHLNIVKWLYENRTDEYHIKYVMMNQCDYDKNLHILRWLRDYCPFVHPNWPHKLSCLE